MMQVFCWIIFDFIYFYVFVFFEERDIKVEQNYIFNHIELWKFN